MIKDSQILANVRRQTCHNSVVDQTKSETTIISDERFDDVRAIVPVRAPDVKKGRCDRRAGQIHVPPAAVKSKSWMIGSATRLIMCEFYRHWVQRSAIKSLDRSML